MDFAKKIRPQEVTYQGQGVFTIVGGKYLKIESTPDGQEVLNEIVPQGKKWVISVSLLITEVDE